MKYIRLAACVWWHEFKWRIRYGWRYYRSFELRAAVRRANEDAREAYRTGDWPLPF